MVTKQQELFGKGVPVNTVSRKVYDQVLGLYSLSIDHELVGQFVDNGRRYVFVRNTRNGHITFMLRDTWFQQMWKLKRCAVAELDDAPQFFIV